MAYYAIVRFSFLSDEITQYFEQEQYAEALYLLAMVDYLSNKYNVPLYNKFHNMRTMKLANIVFPQDIELLAALYKSDAVKKEAWENAVPEFKRHIIVENDLEDTS